MRWPCAELNFSGRVWNWYMNRYAKNGLSAKKKTTGGAQKTPPPPPPGRRLMRLPQQVASGEMPITERSRLVTWKTSSTQYQQANETPTTQQFSLRTIRQNILEIWKSGLHVCTWTCHFPIWWLVENSWQVNDGSQTTHKISARCVLPITGHVEEICTETTCWCTPLMTWLCVSYFTTNFYAIRPSLHQFPIMEKRCAREPRTLPELDTYVATWSLSTHQTWS